MDFTAEQDQAISVHDRNLIVTAGAGSGKTRVLVERYLRLLEANPDWQLTELVAITFTEKAAREMRDRVRQELERRLRDAPTEAEAHRWREHMGLLDNARIGTIHSLCAQLLRANPEKVPVDPAFEVLDENEAALLKSDAVEQTLAAMVEGDQPASRLLLDYSVTEVRKMLNEHVEKIQLLTDSLPADPQALLDTWTAAREQAIARWVNDLRRDQALWDNLNWSPPQGWEAVMATGDKLADVWRKVQAAADFLLAGDAEEVRAALPEVADAIVLRGGSAKNWGLDDLGKAVLAKAKAALKHIRETVEEYTEAFPPPITEQDAEMAELLYLWHEALRLTAQTYKTLKDERAVLDFDDLEQLTAELLRNPDAAARYAEGEFKHLMVDEFQDTNACQREIVEYLTGVRQGSVGRLFVVGDPKQSIYAFRGADVSVFSSVQADLQALGGVKLPLSQSFRTHARLVEVFNDLFSRLLVSREDFEVPFGEPMRAVRPSQPFHATPVKILLLQPPEDAKLSADDLRRWEAYEIARAIHEMVTAPIFDKAAGDYRPMTYGDVAVLFRSLKHAPLYEEVFKAVELPYVTLAGTGYYNRQEVWDILNLLRALHNPADNLALASVLRSPMFGVSDEGLFVLRMLRDEQGRRLPLWTVVDSFAGEALHSLAEDDRAALTFARDCLRSLRNLAGRVTVDELLEAALDQTAYDAILTALPDGDRRRGNVEKLLQKARESGRVALGEFMVYLRDLAGIEPRESEAVVEALGTVKIMTIHKSKGLEFPLVVLANADWKPRPTENDPLIIDPKAGAACFLRDGEDKLIKPFAYHELQQRQARRDLAEHKRLLYVAATRAQDYLLISGAKEDVEGSWLKMILDEGELDGTEIQRRDEPPDLRSLSPTARSGRTGWDVLDQRTPDKGQLPPLVGALPLTPITLARHLSVTQLEELGSAEHFRPPALGRRAFRQSVLHDAPAPIYPIYRREGLSRYGRSRVVGSMVHRALQVGALPSRYPLAKLEIILHAYAWDEGVTDSATLGEVVHDALLLLERFQEPKPLQHAERKLREVPFVLRTPHHILHGTIDLLYQADGEWYVLDYKTADVHPKSVHWHAQRYSLQVGAYAEAVRVRTGQIPTVQLYYLHPSVLVEVPQAAWQAALDGLDITIEAALRGD